MSKSILTADYAIVGASAEGMTVADTLVAERPAHLIIVGRRNMPGGHWNDANPFVRLHGPSTTYGVNWLALGGGRIDEVGLNRGPPRARQLHRCAVASVVASQAQGQAMAGRAFPPSPLYGRFGLLRLTALGRAAAWAKA